MGKSSRKERRNQERTKSKPTARPLKPYAVWDLPTRLTHWSILILFTVQILSAESTLLPNVVHLWGGYLLLLAILFRLVWGFVGSESARIGKLLPRPQAVRAYLPELLSRHPTRYPGHNPVGALSSAALLLLLLASALTGLFVETWGEIRGPLAERVARTTALHLSDWHELLRWPLYFLASVHVFAVLLYLFAKRENRISPMLGHGRIKLAANPGLDQVSARRARRAIPVLLVCCCLVLALIFFGPIV